MGKYLGRLGMPVMNELRQAAIAGLHVCLACADELAFEPERSEIEGHLALLRQVVRSSTGIACRLSAGSKAMGREAALRCF